jgi:hypothetical protein
MKNSLFFVCVSIAVMIGCTSLSAKEDVVNYVITGFTNGQHEIIVNRLSDDAEFVIVDSNYEGKEKISDALSDFFKSHKPVKFTVMHKSKKENSRFVIGNMTTSDGDFRIYFLVKDDLIQQLRIEIKND